MFARQIYQVYYLHKEQLYRVSLSRLFNVRLEYNATSSLIYVYDSAPV